MTSALHSRAITAGSRGFVDSRHFDCAGAAEVSYVYYTRKTSIRYDCNGEEDLNIALSGIRHIVPQANEPIHPRVESKSIPILPSGLSRNDSLESRIHISRSDTALPYIQFAQSMRAPKKLIRQQEALACPDAYDTRFVQAPFEFGTKRASKG